MFRQIWRLPIIWRCYRNTTPLLFSWWHTGLYKRQTQGHTFGVGLCLCWKNDDRLELNRILQMILHCWDSRTIRASLVATLSRDWNQPSGRPHHTYGRSGLTLCHSTLVWPIIGTELLCMQHPRGNRTSYMTTVMRMMMMMTESPEDQRNLTKQVEN